MKTVQALYVFLCVTSFAAAAPRKHHQTPSATATTAAIATVSTATSAAGNADIGSTAVTRGSQTLVLFEVNGVPGNECLTFRNNGTRLLMYIILFNHMFNT